MAKFKRYDSYKNSGVEWLGEIPSHWEILKLKFVSKIETGNSISDDKKSNYECVECKSHPYIATKDINYEYSTINYDNGLRIPKSETNFKIALPDSILICVEGGSAGKKIAYTNQSVCYVNKLASIQTIGENVSKFLYYVIKSYIFKNQFDLSINGLIGGVSVLLIKNFCAVLPPKDEQEKIASYLDEKIAKIDASISGKEKFIELLKEQKQIIINNAVTKGLNKNAKFKNSGVEWIGVVPQHWTITKLKYIGTSIIGLTYNPNNLCGKDEGVLILRSSNIQHGKLILNDNVYIKGYIPKKLFIRENDIVICSRNGSRELIGKCALAKKEDEKYSFGAFMTVFRSKLNFYVFQILNSEIFKKQAGKFLTSTINQLTVNNFNSFEIPLPPKSEQEKIVEYIETKTAKIDKLVNLEQEYIKSLKEYKASLIDSVVTGKVRIV